MRVLVLVGIFAALLLMLRASLGFATAYLLAYGSFSILALGIAGTFGMLYAAHKSELSLGMTVAWLGAAIVNGAWYLSNLLSGTFSPEIPVLLGIALYIAGAETHLRTFQKTLHLNRIAVTGGLIGCFCASLLLYWLFR